MPVGQDANGSKYYPDTSILSCGNGRLSGVHASERQVESPAVEHCNTAAMQQTQHTHWKLRTLTICFGGLLGVDMAS